MPKIITDPVTQETTMKVNEETLFSQESFPQTDLTELESLSAEELMNPEAISVTVTDNTTPIVVLFGPPASGKTMTLIRLSRYLSSLDYTIEPVRSFRPARDKRFEEICKDFNKMVISPWAAALTPGLNFMLLKVSKRGRPVCQILEAPGEYYFNPNNPKEPLKTFVGYIEHIINGSNKKIWINIVEPNWKDQNDRIKFVKKISLLKSKISRRDKSIFLFNKIDDTEFVHGKGEVWMGSARKYIADDYPGIFLPFKNLSPISSLWRAYNCRFVPFVTGSYTKVIVNGEMKVKYELGPDVFPRRLWKEITNLL